MGIELRMIDENNFLDCFNLKLADGQDAFVSHPIRSLAQAYVYRNQCTPFGIYQDNTMVGYVMVIYDYDVPEYNIWHMMIDEKHQGKGYGKEALRKCLDYISAKPFGISNLVALTCSEPNTRAIHLYESLGFKPTDNRDGDEIALVLNL